MSKQDTMILDIGDIYIKVIIGNNKKLILSGNIKTPQGAVLNNNVEDIDAVIQIIDDFRQQHSINAGNVIFVIKGQDVIIRHTDVPTMGYEQMAESSKWEISQYLPDQGEGHYIDFEVIEQINNNNEKINKLLVAAAAKEKIEKYISIANKLNMKVKAIDTAANCVARVFAGVYEKDKIQENIAIIEIGEKETSIVILSKGKLFIERELLFGTSNITNQLEAKYKMTEDEANNYLKEKINLLDVNEESDDEVRIKRLFDNVFSSFEKVIQFFGTGRAKKKLDKIYVTGIGSEIRNIENYIHNFLETDVIVVNNTDDLLIKLPNEFQFKLFSAAYGALIRNNKRMELNLIPYELKSKKISIVKNKKIIIAVSITVVIMVVAAVIPQIILIMKQGENDNLLQQINADRPIAAQNTKLVKQKNDYNKQINTATGIQKGKVYILEWVQGIVNNAPTNVGVTSITTEKGQATITIVGQTKDINAIPLFSKNLQDCGKFTDVKIVSISLDKDSNYKFTITEKEVAK